MRICDLTAYQKRRLSRVNYRCSICGDIILPVDAIKLQRLRVGKSVMYLFSHKRCSYEEKEKNFESV